TEGRSRTTRGCPPRGRAAAPDSGPTLASRPAAPRVLLAAVEAAAHLQRFRARQVQPAMGAGNKFSIPERPMRSCGGRAQRAPHEPYGDDHDHDEHHQATHRAIIYRPELKEES